MVKIQDWDPMYKKEILIHEMPMVESIEYLNSLAYNITITDIEKISFDNSNVRIFMYNMLNTVLIELVDL